MTANRVASEALAMPRWVLDTPTTGIPGRFTEDQELQMLTMIWRVRALYRISAVSLNLSLHKGAEINVPGVT